MDLVQVLDIQDIEVDAELVELPQSAASMDC